jgi:outer membrane protein OmpA-like peptidoglycan-associated protein
MSRTTTCRILAALSLAIMPVSGATAAETCRDHDVAMVAASRAADLVQAEQIVKSATVSAVCSGADLATLGRKAAAVAYARAVKPEVAETERDLLLDRALKLGRIWPVLATLGDRAKMAKKHAEAAGKYQEALDDIRNVVANPTAPPRELIASLVKKAEAESLLAKTYVKRVDRSGAVGGLACQTFRGFTTKRTALPVEFKYKQPELGTGNGIDALTDKGRSAAEDLFAFLSQQGTPGIHLIGHTDPIGSDDFNRQLSERRAATLKGFLVSKGYTGAIRISGKGRDEPFQADDPGSYTEAERHQLDRRVELDREGAAACAAP